jgi:hypothetical protein
MLAASTFLEKLKYLGLGIKQVCRRDHADSARPQSIWELNASHAAENIIGTRRILHQLLDADGGPLAFQQADITVVGVQIPKCSIGQARRHQPWRVLDAKRNASFIGHLAKKAHIFSFRRADDGWRLEDGPISTGFFRCTHKFNLPINARLTDSDGQRDAARHILTDTCQDSAAFTLVQFPDFSRQTHNRDAMSARCDAAIHLGAHCLPVQLSCVIKNA